MGYSSKQFDVIVIGVGGIGSATVYQLAKRGLNVLGLERYSIPNSMGSSHGYTRMIRRAYHEDPSYVSMIERAYELWEDLQTKYGEQLLYKIGSISAGPSSSDLITGALKSCNRYSIPYERLTGEDLSKRFPGFQLPSSYEAIYQPDSGFLRPEEGIIAHIELAHKNGAEIHAREKVTEWHSTVDGIKVRTDKDQYRADRLVIAAGAWTGKLVESVSSSISPERQVIGWFQPQQPEIFTPDAFPVFLVSDMDEIHYGFPIFGAPGVKVGRHYHLQEQIDPDEMTREPTAYDEKILREFTDEYLTISEGKTMGLETCIYTNTPDCDFLIDTLDDHPEVTVLGGFSGHGYKFAGVIGEIAADITTRGETSFDIDPYNMNRFKNES